MGELFSGHQAFIVTIRGCRIFLPYCGPSLTDNFGLQIVQSKPRDQIAEVGRMIYPEERAPTLVLRKEQLEKFLQALQRDHGRLAKRFVLYVTRANI